MRLVELAAAGPGEGHPFVKLVSTPELVEAAVRAHEPATAQAALAEFERFARETAPPWTLALVARCRGLLSAGGAAERHFTDALRLHGEGARPFDRARTELIFGEFLRRDARRKEARLHLRAALPTFEQAGRRHWAERARVELRASGETARERDPSTADRLTPQERQIVRFVAEGLTTSRWRRRSSSARGPLTTTCATSSSSSASPRAPSSSAGSPPGSELGDIADANAGGDRRVYVPSESRIPSCGHAGSNMTDTRAPVLLEGRATDHAAGRRRARAHPPSTARARPSSTPCAASTSTSRPTA